MSEHEPNNPLAEPVAIELPEEVEQQLKEQGKERTSYLGIATIGTLSVFAAAAMLLPCMARAKGATVSADLKWAERQAEIEAAIREIKRSEREKAGE